MEDNHPFDLWDDDDLEDTHDEHQEPEVKRLEYKAYIVHEIETVYVSNIDVFNLQTQLIQELSVTLYNSNNLKDCIDRAKHYSKEKNYDLIINTDYD